ncbi:UvrD-helicase-domain-containing protein [Tothia fuscella]|uniref:DNA 3'-5' helicase n=1 Tax=Tothia fuscella TaxID=1048955 RepID=A0A9P4P5E5_9PEZI|nr:UvrD-helicase-domain-containing protein [Tothia fuscella]
MDSLLHGLNDHQKTAVTSQASVLQVLAPPGSGKTKTLTTRVAYHIAHEGLKPWNMIVCTFTIKAANEMKERIRSFVGDKLENKLVLGTFHGVARRYLVQYGHHIGLPKQFGIADSADSMAIIKRIIKRHDFTLDPSKARGRISKRKCRTLEERPRKSKMDVEQQEFESIFEKYEEALRSSNLLDYDDLLLRCAELLKRCPECVSNIEAVLIDEFQDTNNVQYELMSLFAQHQKPRLNRRVPSITIVGDPDQSIYGFRMAEIKNLHRMRDQYTDTQVVHLEDNYRSSGSILHAAIEVIEQDESRPAKRLLATHTTGERPILRTLPSAVEEAAWIVAEIERVTTLTAHLLTYLDFAILLRSANLSRTIESALGKAGIPYRMVGGSKFFDRIEVKTLLDYFRVISQPEHNDALARIINTPARGIGEITCKGLLEEAEKSKRSLWKFVLDIAQGRRRPATKISVQAQKGLEIFSNIILTSQNKVDSQVEPCTVADLMLHVIKKLGYKEYLQAKYPQEFENRWANVEELVILASDKALGNPGDDAMDADELIAIDGVSQSSSSGVGETLSKFLANVTLTTAVDAGEAGAETNQLTISTIHAAKGLEWPAVFIPAAYQGSIPHSRADDADEERRLLYVGMTRAQCLLYLSWPKKNSGSEATTVSPFLSPRAITNCFSKKGPSIGFLVSQEIGRILGREAPPEIAVRKAQAAIERAEDDLWPEDGEEIPTENPRWNKKQLSSDPWTSNYSSDPLTYDPAWKRPKITHSSMSLSAVSVANSGDYSISNTTMTSGGFITAGSHMKLKFNDEPIEHVSQLQPEAAPKPTAAAINSRTKQPSAQGSIQNFFVRPVSSTANISEVKKEKQLKKHPKRTVQQKAGMHSAPLQEVTNWKTGASRVHQPINSSLQTSHKLKSERAIGRPRRSFEDEEQTATKYVLLSSSPIKEASDHHPIDHRLNEEPISQGATGIVPVSTYHTTTMAQVSNQQQGLQRRNLGMRRNVQGWSSQVQNVLPKPSSTH